MTEKAMSAPADADRVDQALRLGWCVAEVRGRNRPDGPKPPGVALTRDGHVLPLRIERSSTELRIEAQSVLSALAGQLGVNGPVVSGATIDAQAKALDDARNPRTGGHAPPGGRHQRCRMRRSVARGPGQIDNAWNDLASSLYTFDAHAQDVLAATSEAEAAAYQLGRGLAEAYWALDPDVPCSKDQCPPDSWTFLLGAPRCEELSLIAGRLSAYFNPFAAPALAGTLHLWEDVAASEDWRKVPTTKQKDGSTVPGAQACLYEQIRQWYGLLILGQDPSTLTEPYEVFSHWRLWGRVLRAFWLPLVAVVLSLVAVGALIALTAVASKTQTQLHFQFLRGPIGVLSAAGLSGAAIATKLKNSAQGLLSRMHQDAYTDLVAVKLARVPDKPALRVWSMDTVKRRAIDHRRLTTVAGARVP
jgi:hypothetical protein